MKIAITGTRGIPNNYGGFEQFAENLSAGLAEKGHEVRVYNPAYHPFHGDFLGKVRIVRKWSPEKLAGPGANYIYDYLCLRDAVQRRVDIILECGYASAAPSYSLIKKGNTRIVTHMDGMEWQREKWGSRVKQWMRKAEHKAVRMSDAIVCDHPVIEGYYRDSYNVDPVYIGYGAKIPQNPDKRILEDYRLEQYGYYIMVARLEPENHPGRIIEGFLASGTGMPLLVVGDLSGRYGRKLHQRYHGNNLVRFAGSIFDREILDSLRYFSKGSFHGHSAGGTNPSLLEAMACRSDIIAHDNVYNRYILGENGRYFRSSEDIARLLPDPGTADEIEQSRKANREKVLKDHHWDAVTEKYEKLFQKLAGAG